MEASKILIVSVAIILLITISLSLISTRRHGPVMNGPGINNPDPAVCNALRGQLDWDDPAYRLLCSETGGGRGGRGGG